MDVKKYIRSMLLFISCLSAAMLLTGCLRDYFPYIFREKEEPQTVIPERPGQEYAGEEEQLPEGVLYLQVYYLEGTGNYLLPVTISIPWTEGVARAALEKLIEGPSPAQEMRYGLISPLPPTTEVLGLTIRDGLAKVDFTESLLSYDPGMERQVLNSIVFTLLQFPTVKDVQILVEGIAPDLFPGGTSGKGTFNRERGVNLEVAEEVTDFAQTQPLTLYFCTVLGENRIFYVPVTRIIGAEQDLFKAALTELLKGPRPGHNLFSELPPDTELRNVTLQGDTLVADFSRGLLNYKGGLSGEKNIVAQIVLTLTEISSVEKVQVLIEGGKTDLTYGTTLQEPLLRPLLINPLT